MLHEDSQLADQSCEPIIKVLEDNDFDDSQDTIEIIIPLSEITNGSLNIFNMKSNIDFMIIQIMNSVNMGIKTKVKFNQS